MFWERVETIWAKADGRTSVGWSFFAFGLLRSWSILLMVSFGTLGFVQPAALTISAENLVSIVEIISWILLTVVACKGAPLYRRGSLVVGSTVVMTAGFILFAVTAPLGDSCIPACLTGLVCTVAGSCCMYILWLELFGCIGPRRLMMVFAGSTIVNAVLLVFLRSAGSTVIIATLVILPAVICFSYLFAYKGIAAEDMPREEVTPFGPYARITLWLAIFAFALGVALTLMEQDYYDMLYLGRSICALAVMVGLVFLSSRFKLVMLYRVSMPVAVIGLIVVMLWSSSAPGASTLFMGFSSWTYYTVAMLVPCGVMYQSKKSTVWICGILNVIITGVEWLGMQLETSLLTIVQHETGVYLLAGVIVVLLILAAVVFFKESDFSAQWNLVNYPVAPAETEVDISERCELVAREHNLSPQEKTVLLLVESGLTNNDISEKLFIAPGTVRAHIGRIYKKLDVHSREELDALVKG